MTTFGRFELLETLIYTAVALPTESDGSFIVVLPKPSVNLDKVEKDVVKSGQNLESFILNFAQATPKKPVRVILPRLKIQVTHEWSTPSNKVCVPTGQ